MGYGERTVPTIVPKTAAAKQFGPFKNPVGDLASRPPEGSGSSNASLLRNQFRISRLQPARLPGLLTNGRDERQIGLRRQARERFGLHPFPEPSIGAVPRPHLSPPDLSTLSLLGRCRWAVSARTPLRPVRHPAMLTSDGQYETGPSD